MVGVRRPPKLHRKPALVVLAAALLAGCGGSSPGRSTSSRSERQPAAASSTTTSTIAAPSGPGVQVAPTPLSAAEAKRVASICRRAQTSEDSNVIVQFAVQGERIYSPSVQAALKHASADLSSESAKLGKALNDRPSDRILATEVDSEAMILSRAGRDEDTLRDSTSLLLVLHRRITDADDARVAGCAGANAKTLPA